MSVDGKKSAANAPTRRWTPPRLGLRRRLWFVVFAVACLWLIQLADLTRVFGDLNRFGIVPREVRGLRGIPLAPFLHEGFGHLAANTLPLLALGGLVALRGTRTLLAVSVFVTLVTGFATWSIARGGIHLGASGLVFGYFGYLLTAAIIERSLKSVLIAAVTVLLYGSLLWGVLPTQPQVSWEGHLFGFLAGILAARVGARRPRRSQSPLQGTV